MESSSTKKTDANSKAKERADRLHKLHILRTSGNFHAANNNTL